MRLREQYQLKLEELQDDLLMLGSLVSKACKNGVTALVNRDNILAEEVISGDQEINRRRFYFEEKVLQLLATQNPVAKDLRLAAAGLFIVNELERMGDYAKGIARISQSLETQPLINPALPLPQMADVAASMLEQALTAFTNRDAELAMATGIRDDELDLLYNSVASDLLELMLADRANISQANLLLWAAHNLERIGDRITNICERVIFVCTGQLIEIPGFHNRKA